MELNDKVFIDNLCNWPLYFKRMNGIGDVRIPANAKRFAGVDVAEVQMQIQLDNKLFTGDDQHGSHARLYIVDDEQRKQLLSLGEESGVSDAVVLNGKAVAALLAIRTKKDFHERLSELVKTNAEKKMIVQLAKENGGDDVSSWKMEAINKLAETATL